MALIDDENVYFSLLKGMRYTFYLEDIKIEYQASGWTGYEKVLVNGEVKSAFRSFSTNTEHQFIYDNTEYKVLYDARQFLSSKFKCSLFVNNKFKKSYKIGVKEAYKFSKYINWGIFLIFVISQFVLEDYQASIAFYLFLASCLIWYLLEKFGILSKTEFVYEIES